MTSYIFDRGRTDQERLRRTAAAQSAVARDACRHAGLRPGDRAIDVGCGPLGALPVLAELVGPDGAVVGLDVSASALDRAREAVAREGLTNITLIQGDINTLDVATLTPHAPFDLAFCRLFLGHQADPAATLRRIAGLLRPGGRIVAQDPLHDAHFPRCEPPIPAMRRVFELLTLGIRHKGGSPDVARGYRALVDDVGLRFVSQRGFFQVPDEPSDLVAATRSILQSMRDSVVDAGLASSKEIAALDGELATAEAERLTFAAGTLMIVLTAETGPMA